MKEQRLTILAAMMAFALAAAASAASVSTQSSTDKKSYVLGAVYDITGAASFMGIPQRNAARMLVDQVNKQGGINGHPVELRVLDDKSNPSEAALAIKKLIEEDHVLAVLGATTSGASLAMLPIATEKHIPLVSNGLSVRIVEPVEDRKWIFKTAQTDAHSARVIVSYLIAKKLTNVSFIASNSDFGSSGLAEFQKLAAPAGINLVSVQRYSDSDTDMTPQLAKIKESSAQVLVTWGTVPGTAYVSIGRRQLGLTIPEIQSASTSAFLEMAGEAANGVLIPSVKLLVADNMPAGDPQAAVVKKFADDYRATFRGQTASIFAGYAYDGMLLVLAAIRNAGADPTPAGIRDQLEKLTNLPGVTSVYSMSPTDHNGCSPDAFIWVRIADGKYVLN